MHNAMDELKDILCRELDEIAHKGELSAGDLDTVYKLIISKEKLLRIEEIEEDMGYSQSGGMWHANGSYARGRSYDNGYGDSYGRHYVRGHYSRGRYSMADGKQMIADQIRDMLDDGSLSQADKSALERAMRQLEK